MDTYLAKRTAYADECINHSYSMACSLAYAIVDMPKDPMRKLAEDRLREYADCRSRYDGYAFCNSVATQFLLSEARLSLPSEPYSYAHI